MKGDTRMLQARADFYLGDDEDKEPSTWANLCEIMEIAVPTALGNLVRTRESSLIAHR